MYLDRRNIKSLEYNSYRFNQKREHWIYILIEIHKRWLQITFYILLYDLYILYALYIDVYVHYVK